MEAKFNPRLMERRIQERLYPKPGDYDYLHVADLLLAMKEIATSEPLTLLDYGSGSSPYRALFPHSQYRRADIATLPCTDEELEKVVGRTEGHPEPDYIIHADGRVPHESNSLDLVLSTQVLEHVRDPQTHLAECLRLLKPAGRLFLTTHGSWHDHGDPHDFWRWTAEGLKYDLEKTGFNVLSVKKLTTGPRAVLWFLQRHLLTQSLSRRTLFGLCHWLCRLVPPNWIHKQADRLYSNHRIVPADVPGHKIYLAVAAYAQRPAKL